MIGSALGRRFPLLAFARNNLTRARARTALAMAGITIGVLAIASLGMFGVALEQFFLDDASGFTHTVIVGAGEDAPFESLDRDHVDRIEQISDYPAYPVEMGQGAVAAKKTETTADTIRLSDPRPFVSVAEGEVPSNWRDGVLVGATLAEDLAVAPGDSVVVDGERHRVHGVLEQAGQASMLGPDEAVVFPAAAGESSGYDAVLVRADSPNAAFETSDALDSELNAGREETFDVQDAEVAIENFNQQMAVINTFLLGIGGISLLVASVSILNVMLMSTIERKGEIGVLRAVGYHRLDVLRLMLNEAVLLGAVGAVFGVVLSVLLGALINAELLGDPLAFTGEALLYVALGFCFGTGASFLSGLYPAWKAANARPVEALRD